MFSEVLKSYDTCCKRYEKAYPDVVGQTNLQNLVAASGSFQTLDSLCAIIRKNAEDRAFLLSKLLKGRERSVEELIKDIDAELGCDEHHGFPPVTPSYKRQQEGDRSPNRPYAPSPPRNPYAPPSPPSTPYAPPPPTRRPLPPSHSPDFHSPGKKPVDSDKPPSRTPPMPIPKTLDEASIALGQQYRRNLALYAEICKKLLKSCNDIALLHEEIVVKRQIAQTIANDVYLCLHRPKIAVDVLKKRKEAHAALDSRLKDLRKKMDVLSSRLAQRESLHSKDVEIYSLQRAINQHQKIFRGKKWFVDFQNKLCSFQSFKSSSDVRAVEIRLHRLKSSMDAIAATLKAAAMRVNADISTEKGRREAIDDAQSRLDNALRNTQLAYRRMSPRGALQFHVASTRTGKLVRPSLEEIQNEVSAVIRPLWQRLTTNCQEICKNQKDLNHLSAADLNQTKTFPAFVILGGVRIQCESYIATAPFLSAFPFVRPRLFRVVDQVAPFIMRLIYAMPIGGIRLNIIDHAAVGAHGRDFNQLPDVEGGLVKIVTTQDDIRGALQDILNYMGDLARTKFTGRITNWQEYNKENPTAFLPCTLLAIYSFKGWEHREVELLEPILERGGQCGVFIVCVSDGLREMDERLRKSIKPERFAMMPPDISKSDFSFGKISASWQPIDKLAPRQWETLVRAYKNAYEEKTSRTSHTFADLYSDVAFWSCNSTCGIDTVIGWDASDTPQHFRLGFGNEARNHVLMGGRNGSGKSNLIHVTIRSLCYRYSPEELTLYLLDFKDGVEFFRYTDKGKSSLPHARTISAHNDPNYALAMLESLVAEMERRNGIFRAAGVVGLEEYRLKTHQKMARILVVVDEFTVMFSSDDSVERIADLTAALLNRGRSAGIHLLLATQTVASFSVRGAQAMFQQLAVRLALPGDGSEGFLNGMDHSDVSSLRIPQCIYNGNAGAPGSNHVFVHPRFCMEDPSSAEYRRKMEEGVAKLGGWSKFPCRVFNGFVLPPMPPKDQFGAWIGSALRVRRRFELVLGVHSDFAGNVCKATFDDEAAEDHLLIAYEKDERGAARGLWESILKSLAALPDKAVLLYDPEQTKTLRLSSPGFDVASANTDRGELLEKLKALRGSKTPHKVLIVENFVSARYLHPKKTSPIGWDDDDSKTTESTDSLFKSAFEDSENIPFHVICFTRRVRTAMEKLGNSILPKFSKRIAFSLNGDDLIDLMPRTRGMNASDKILFSDESSPDGIVNILPFQSTLKV